MPHRSREIIEEYTLEIISRSQAIQVRCNKLLAKDFASYAPRALSTTLMGMCYYLEEAAKAIYKQINWDSITDDKLKSFLLLLQDTDTIIRELGAHVRYVDGARTNRLPWSIIKPIEKFTKNLIPDRQIMLRPQWKYNYSIVTTDLRQAYYDSIKEYQDYLPDISLNDKVLKDFKLPFHIVSFPSLERKNILLHCLISHEIGHLISRTYFSKSRVDEFLKNARNEIDVIVRNTFSKDPDNLFVQYQIQTQIQQEIERANFAWQRGLEEILSDIIGALLFGPAMLFSALEIAIQYDIDCIPSSKNNYYPPWRLRLREILKILLDSSEEFFPLPKSIFISEKIIESVNKRFALIKDITQKENDKEAIHNDPILKLAYREIDKDISQSIPRFKVDEQIKKSIIKSSDLYRSLPHLIERIDNGIPPNAYENTINDRKHAELVEIINAAWFHKIAWEDNIFNSDGSFNKDICKKRDILNRLTLKAIEYADIEKEYREKIGKPDKYEVDK
ncbi:MAG: hypothetical protein HZA14_11425 [Nitrospirae bacterium]|nr:hypothetical protein [Nitrospirota bacterium]